MHWLAYFLGLTSANGWPYLLWSGLVGDLTFVGAGLAIYRRHACHVARCWRIGRHSVDDGTYMVCAKHHPDVPRRIRPHHIARRYHR